MLTAVPLTLSACAEFSPDSGMDTVAAITGETTGRQVVKLRNDHEARAAEDRVRLLLRRRLTANNAVQIALLNNRGLQAAYNALALTEAKGVEDGLPSSPTLSLSRLAASGELEIERQILVNVLGLFTLRERREIAEVQFRQAQFKAAEETLRIIAEAKRTYYRAVASAQTERLLQEAKATAEAASELTKKLGESGAASKIDQAREHVFYAEVTGELGRARQTKQADREALIRVLGLWGADIDFQLPSSLPPLPRQARRKTDIEREALQRRVDVEMARLEVEATAKMLGLTHATRLVNVLEIAGKSKYERVTNISDSGAKETQKTHWRGAEIAVEVPLFDFGQRAHEAEESYRQASTAAQKGHRRALGGPRSLSAYRAAYELARHYRDEIVPLRKTIAEENLLRYNGMLTGVFDLLADARDRIASVTPAIDVAARFLARRDRAAGGAVGGGSAGAVPEWGRCRRREREAGH